MPMLLGMTETHNGNLNPVFDRGDSPTLACPAEDDMWSASYCAVSSVGGLLAASPGAVDATLCTKSRVRDVGDRSLGECAIPSVDFRAHERRLPTIRRVYTIERFGRLGVFGSGVDRLCVSVVSRVCIYDGACCGEPAVQAFALCALGTYRISHPSSDVL